MQALKVCVAFVSVFFASQFTETVFHIDIAVAVIKLLVTSRDTGSIPVAS